MDVPAAYLHGRFRVGRRSTLLRIGVASAVTMATLPAVFRSSTPALATAPDPSVVGSFSAPFEEGTPGAQCNQNADKLTVCKPTAVGVVGLADGRVLYWDSLAGSEGIAFNTVAEIGDTAVNDQTRVLDMRSGTASWIKPSPADGGANPGGYNSTYLIPGVTGSNGGDPNHHNDGALFCSDPVQLSNGRVLVVGGTDWYDEPQIPGTRYGVAELEGMRNARVFDPATNTWSETSPMNFGRWYPSLVTMPDGTVFIAGGVTKLVKPVYLNNLNDSGRNITETEVYSPVTGNWTTNPASANKSLPLFPRLHLLPDGHVFYDGAGQAFNPAGEAYDEALWNLDSVYNPVSQTWTNVGIPGIGTLSPGFRGSAFSVMLPLQSPYTSASFLSAGGVLGVTPGSYIATATSEINTVDTAHGDALTTAATGDLSQARWYGTGVGLPDGTVAVFSGANRDEVDLPGTGNPIHQAEIFDPATRKWTPMATAHDDRVYHNTAVLLPDGRVLVGGHAPIPTLYAYPQTLPGGFSSNFRDPSFEIFSPPYLFHGPQPVITSSPDTTDYAGSFTVVTPDATNIGSVVLVRNPSLTHLVDGDQRTVELPFTVAGSALHVTAPPSASVAPPGGYMLFVNKKTSQGLVPSKSREIFVGAPMPSWVHGATAPEPPPVAAGAPQPVPAPLIGPFPPLPGGATSAAAQAAWQQTFLADVRQLAGWVGALLGAAARSRIT